MGQCVCKESASTATNQAKPSRPPLPNSGVIQTKSPQKAVVRDSEVSACSQESVQTQHSSSSRMFSQYTKLPPIRKAHNNNDTKRLSLECSETKVNLLFDHYKNEENVIGEEGIVSLCNDLHVRPDDFIVLVLAWKFNAEMMGRFTRSEFVNGCKAIQADSIRGLLNKFPQLLSEVQNKQTFKEMYRWTYKFGLTVEPGQRTLGTDVAIQMWKVVFAQKEPPILERWLRFLDKHDSIRGIPRDTWDMFLHFTEQVGSDLSNYDESEAWPSLLDDFVEYENDLENQNVRPDELEC